MSFSSNLGEINLGEFNLGDYSVSASPELTLSITDNLSTWGDAFEGFSPFNLEFADALAQLDDGLEYATQDGLSIADNFFAAYDEVETYLGRYIHLLGVMAGDLLELVDDLSYSYVAAETLVVLGDGFILSDEINLQDVLELAFEDTLEFADEVEVMAGEFVDYAYDSMMYDIGDAIAVDLRQHRSIIDIFNLLDAVSVSVANFLVSQTVTDSLNSWNDVIALRVICSDVETDTLKMYDFVKYFLTTIRSIGDVFSLSDSVIVGLSVTNEELNDSANLWADLVAASMTVPLTVVKSDTLTQSDTVSNSGIQEDTSYYRRYLNDVKV